MHMASIQTRENDRSGPRPRRMSENKPSEHGRHLLRCYTKPMHASYASTIRDNS
jgi:hypothetical protein